MSRPLRVTTNNGSNREQPSAGSGHREQNFLSFPSIASRHEVGPREDQNGCNKRRCDKSFHRENMPSTSPPFQVQKH